MYYRNYLYTYTITLLYYDVYFCYQIEETEVK